MCELLICGNNVQMKAHAYANLKSWVKHQKPLKVTSEKKKTLTYFLKCIPTSNKISSKLPDYHNSALHQWSLTPFLLRVECLLLNLTEKSIKKEIPVD